MDADRRWMRAALSLARRGLGRVWPNPAVGCVIVQGDRVVGRGWTQPGGRPHAETMALAQAGAAANGATAYVSLEPCAHYGKTPPCCDALIAAGIARVVAPMEDPDPRVAGQGFARMRAAGMTVEIGLMAEEAALANEGFLMRQRSGRPMVTLKLASSLDGRIATASGESRWITGALVDLLKPLLAFFARLTWLSRLFYAAEGEATYEKHSPNSSSTDFGEETRQQPHFVSTRRVAEADERLSLALLAC